MSQDYFPWQPGRRLTPELFDHYIAKARAERAKAIADFGGWIARKLRATVAGLGSRRPVPVTRKLAG
jgi:hypothetical protein